MTSQHSAVLTSSNNLVKLQLRNARLRSSNCSCLAHDKSSRARSRHRSRAWAQTWQRILQSKSLELCRFSGWLADGWLMAG